MFPRTFDDLLSKSTHRIYLFHVHTSTFCDDYRMQVIPQKTNFFNLFKHIESIQDLAKDCREIPFVLNHVYLKDGIIFVSAPPILPRYHIARSQPQVSVFIIEILAINRFTTGAISLSDISTLDHAARQNVMNLCTLVVQRLARFTNTLATITKRGKVFYTFGCPIAIQAYNNIAFKLSVDFDTKVGSSGD